jgi:hypothetical protein
MIIIKVFFPLVWTGMIAGISFIETPLKFRAPGVTLPLGLGIGQLVFRALNKIEWAFFILWALPLLITRHVSPAAFIIPVIGVVLLLQTAWWLPHLDKRARIVQQGGQPEGRSLHIFYALAEVVKCILLSVYACINILHYKI